MMLQRDSSKSLGFVIITCVCINVILIIRMREDIRKHVFKKISNNEYEGSVSIDEIGNSISKWKTYEIVNEGLSVETNMTKTLNSDRVRLRRGIDGCYLPHSRCLNDFDFLDLIPDDLYRNASAYLLTFCSKLHVCNYDVISGIKATGFSDRCSLQCDCSAMCHFNQSCCPFVEPVATPIAEYNVSSSCQYPLLFFHSSQKTSYKQLTGEFIFITSCPQGSDMVTTNLCEHPFFGNGYSMINLLPVTDGDNVVNFANRHCAKCNHRTQNLHLWLPNIRCKSIPEVSSIPYIEEKVRVRDDCYIVLKPPATLDVNSTRCVTDVINQCNITGKWREYNLLLEEACNSIRTIYTSHDTKIRYANIFCAICNDETVWILTGPSIGDVTGYTLLLAYSLHKETLHSKDKCTLGTLYDPIRNECQKVHCSFPFQLNPYSMYCTDGVLATNKGKMALPIKVTYNVPVKISYIRFTSILYVILNKHQYSVCRIAIYFKTSISLTKWQMLSQDQKNNISINESIIIFEFDSETDQLLSIAVLNDVKKLLTSQHMDSINQVTFETSVGNLDSGMLNTEYDQQVTLDEHYWWEKVNGNTVLAFEDPYNNHVVIGHLNITYYYSTCYEEESPILYSKEFMECPSFLYDIHQCGITRHSKGLVLSSLNVMFEFGTFQSENASHVHICTDSVISRVANGSHSIEYIYMLLVSCVVFIV